MWPALRQVDAVLKVCLPAPNACKALAVRKAFLCRLAELSQAD